MHRSTEMAKDNEVGAPGATRQRQDQTDTQVPPYDSADTRSGPLNTEKGPVTQREQDAERTGTTGAAAPAGVPGAKSTHGRPLDQPPPGQTGGKHA
jgi:hypothetical protein